MIYSICEIQQRIAPVAKAVRCESGILFGSYARGETREDSDIDLLVDTQRNEPCAVFSLWEHCIATLKRRCKSRSI